MKNLILLFAAVLLAAFHSACVGPDAPKLDDRIHGSVGVQASNLDTSRFVPDRPYTSAPSSTPSTSSTPSGPVLIPGSSN